MDIYIENEIFLGVIAKNKKKSLPEIKEKIAKNGGGINPTEIGNIFM